jgi:branched-chain amino acid aminotransferase
MEKKNIDGPPSLRLYAHRLPLCFNFKDGKWDDGELTTDTISLECCACVLQYAQTVLRLKGLHHC